MSSPGFLKSKRNFIFFINNYNTHTGYIYNKKLLQVKSFATKMSFYPIFVKSKKHFFNKYFKPWFNSASKFQQKSNLTFDLFKLNKVLFLRFFLLRLRSYLFSSLNSFKHALCYYLKPIVLLIPSNVTIIGLNDLTIDAKFLANFISYYLENRYYLVQIFKVLWSYLNKSIKNRLLYGYQIKLSGRFKKNEKAVYMLRKVGNLGRYDIKRFVDYSCSVARMRLGVTGVKV